MIYLIGFGFGIIICIPVWLIIQSCIISDMKCQVEALKDACKIKNEHIDNTKNILALRDIVLEERNDEIMDLKKSVGNQRNRIIRLEETKKDLEGKAMLKDDEVIQYSDLLLKLKNKLTSANLEIETAKAFCRDYISDEF